MIYEQKPIKKKKGSEKKKKKKQTKNLLLRVKLMPPFIIFT